MGVVYLRSELESGQIPTETGHLEAAQLLLAKVPLIDGVVTTMVHGSVPEQRSNRRSDLDALVCHGAVGTYEPAVTRLIKTELEAIEDLTGVKVEANIWPSMEHPSIRAGRMYDPLFVGHLAKSMGHEKWIRGSTDPVVLEIASSARSRTPQEMREIILDYIVYKHTGFAKAPAEYRDTSSCSAPLQRALELPKATARKIIQMREILGQPIKRGVGEAFQQLAEEGLRKTTLDAIEGLIRIDRECTEVLESSLTKGKPGVEGYGVWLENSYPLSIDLGITAASGFADFVASSNF